MPTLTLPSQHIPISGMCGQHGTSSRVRAAERSRKNHPWRARCAAAAAGDRACGSAVHRRYCSSSTRRKNDGDTQSTHQQAGRACDRGAGGTRVRAPPPGVLGGRARSEDCAMACCNAASAPRACDRLLPPPTAARPPYHHRPVRSKLWWTAPTTAPASPSSQGAVQGMSQLWRGMWAQVRRAGRPGWWGRSRRCLHACMHMACCTLHPSGGVLVRHGHPSLHSVPDVCASCAASRAPSARADSSPTPGLALQACWRRL